MLTDLIFALLPHGVPLRLDAVSVWSDQIVISATSTQTAAACPDCQQHSTSIHSRYVRILADLPWAAQPLQLRLTIHKFFCRNLECPRRIFAQSLPALTKPFARRTNRLRAEQEQLALSHGGEAGARTAHRLHMPISADTLLRLARRAVPSQASAPRHIGVDEWAYRRGRRYGTLIVDLDQHRALDLLPDRSADSFAAWLKERPSVTVIARDRAGVYADGAARGAPHALQVADRFHLVQNLRETLERLLTRHQAVLHRLSAPLEGKDEQALTGITISSTNDDASAALSSQPPTRAQAATAERRARRLSRYEQVMALHRAGKSIHAIAQEIHVSRYLVRRYLRADQFPETAQRRKRPTQIEPFVTYLQAQLDGGNDNALQLWRDVQALGYRGSASRLRQWVSQHRAPNAPSTARPRRGPRPKLAHKQQRPVSARTGSWLLLREREKLVADEQVRLDRLLAAHPHIASGYAFAQRFADLVRERGGSELEAWLAAVEASELPDFQGFARGLRQDYAAVQAGLTLEWNSGQVEGQVNRLKLIKRMAYGRAKFDLFRQRVLAA